MNSGDIAPVLVTLIITGAVTLLLALRMRLRAREKAGGPELKEIAERLARMEQAIDAMAIETERIAEGQRFTTKLLSERKADALPRA